MKMKCSKKYKRIMSILLLIVILTGCQSLKEKEGEELEPVTSEVSTANGYKDTYVEETESPIYSLEAGFSVGDKENAVVAVSDILKALEQLDHDTYLSYIDWDNSGSGAYYTIADPLSMAVYEVAYAQDMTENIIERYSGSDLLASQGISDTYFASNCAAVYVLYHATYDHTKTFMEDGLYEGYYDMIYINDRWHIWDQAIYSTNSDELPSERLLSTKELVKIEDYGNQPYPLIASIPEQQVYLYADYSFGGAVLRVDDRIQKLDWLVLFTPRFILPRVSRVDINEDSDDEIIAILNIGSGTGVSIDELHVLQLNEEGLYEDYKFIASMSTLSERLAFAYDETSNELTVSMDEKEVSLQVEGITNTIKMVRLSYDILSIEYDREITITIPVAFSSEDAPVPEYNGLMMQGHIDFIEGSFRVTWDQLGYSQ